MKFLKTDLELGNMRRDVIYLFASRHGISEGRTCLGQQVGDSINPAVSIPTYQNLLTVGVFKEEPRIFPFQKTTIVDY